MTQCKFLRGSHVVYVSSYPFHLIKYLIPYYKLINYFLLSIPSRSLFLSRILSTSYIYDIELYLIYKWSLRLLKIADYFKKFNGRYLFWFRVNDLELFLYQSLNVLLLFNFHALIFLSLFKKKNKFLCCKRTFFWFIKNFKYLILVF